MIENITYSEDEIITLSWNEHIRQRPGMYVGDLGDGTSPDDGVYVLIKEVVDNSIDEFMMGFGKKITITIDKGTVTVRDYGRGVPLGKLKDVSSKINTGGKFDGKAFKKSVGLNGVGIKAVNALSSYFLIYSVRGGNRRIIEYSGGEVVSDISEVGVGEMDGTFVSFTPDIALFKEYHFNNDYIVSMIKNYTYLNCGLSMILNGDKYISKNGLVDLLNDKISDDALYAPIRLIGEDIEVAMTHGTGYNEMYYSFVNSQNTTQGGTHQTAFREAVAKVIKEFYKKDFDPADVRASIVAAVSVRIVEPVFANQTKTRLGSKDMVPGGISVRNYIVDFLKHYLDNYLHKNPSVAEVLHKKILAAEKERKAISGVQKKAREFAKRASLNNKKLRDCRVHYNTKKPNAEETMIFITEGDSASGSITKSRNANIQAVFSLRGKPLNTYELTKKVIYENEEFNLLQAALNIEEDMDNLRYNKVIIATDADVDGMHIRLLLMTFFLKFFPDMIYRGHLHILETPLFRVRNKSKTIYCYSEAEKEQAIKSLKNSVEITRFKGLGEISADEFANFIGKDMRLEKIRINPNDSISDLLEFYMGKNTYDRQRFIINNLKVEEDIKKD